MNEDTLNEKLEELGQMARNSSADFIKVLADFVFTIKKNYQTEEEAHKAFGEVCPKVLDAFGAAVTHQAGFVALKLLQNIMFDDSGKKK